MFTLRVTRLRGEWGRNGNYIRNWRFSALDRLLLPHFGTWVGQQSSPGWQKPVSWARHTPCHQHRTNSTPREEKSFMVKMKMKTQKAKVVASVWEEEFVKFFAALAVSLGRF